MTSDKGKLVQNYISENPNVPSRTLGRKIYSENPLLFSSEKAAYGAVRWYKGTSGKKNRRQIATDIYLTPAARAEKYNLPESIEQTYEPFTIIGKKGLIFSDVHIPFHDIPAIQAMFDYTRDMDLDFVLINGDFMDCFDISRFSKEPDLIRLKDERDLTKQFLSELKRIYPTAKIYYKFGNHEKRFEQYLQIKAPELFGFTEFRLDVLLGLFEMGIQYIPEEKYVNISGLSIFHGHEYANGTSSPANPARTVYLRAKESALAGHHHQTSEHTDPSISGKITTTWSTGCLCGLHPKYMPLNRWNHGFALYEREDDKFWRITNKRIIDGRVV